MFHRLTPTGRAALRAAQALQQQAEQVAGSVVDDQLRKAWEAAQTVQNKALVLSEKISNIGSFGPGLAATNAFHSAAQSVIPKGSAELLTSAVLDELAKQPKTHKLLEKLFPSQKAALRGAQDQLTVLIKAGATLRKNLAQKLPSGMTADHQKQALALLEADLKALTELQQWLANPVQQVVAAGRAALEALTETSKAKLEEGLRTSFEAEDASRT